MTTQQKLDLLSAKTTLWSLGFDIQFLFSHNTTHIYQFRQTDHETVSCGWCRKLFDANVGRRRLFCSRQCANLRNKVRAAKIKADNAFPVIQIRIERDKHGNAIAPPRIEKLKKEKMDAWT